MKKLFCLMHDYKVLRVESAIIGKGWPYSMVYKKCKKCGKIKYIGIKGHWDIDELEGYAI